MENLRNSKLALTGLALLSVFFFWLMNLDNKENKNDEREGSDTAKEEVFVGELKTERFVNEAELNNTVMSVFLHGLVGTDTKILLTLFKSEMLDQDIRKMNPTELDKYAEEVGKKIKNNKEVVRTRVLEVEEDNEKKSYKIEIEFRNNTSKIIKITTENGSIITPIESLY